MAETFCRGEVLAQKSILGARVLSLNLLPLDCDALLALEERDLAVATVSELARQYGVDLPVFACNFQRRQFPGERVVLFLTSKPRSKRFRQQIEKGVRFAEKFGLKIVGVLNLTDLAWLKFFDRDGLAGNQEEKVKSILKAFENGKKFKAH